MKSNRKKLLIAAVAVVTAGAIGAGVWFGVRSGGEPVNVFPFRYIGMTEYWGDNQESYGPVSTDRIQTVYLTETQTVTEIKVAAGDSVKKGDLLMTFDTTLSDIALERKRLDVEKLKLQLENAQERLREIRSMKPMKIPEFDDTEDEDEDKGTPLTEDCHIFLNQDHNGESREESLICWLHSGTKIDDTLLETIRQKVEAYRNRNVPKPQAEAAAVTEGTEPEESWPEETEPSYIDVNDYYVIFKMTGNNMSLGDRLVWQGMHVRGRGHDFTFSLYDTRFMTDPMLLEEEDVYVPEIDYGSGYTAAQLAEMRSEQEKKIKQLQFDIKMADAEYRIMLTEVSDGNVYSEIDGEVVSVLTEEEAKLQQQPIVKVSGGGGFYVEGSVSELEKDNLIIGQEVTINDWNTGMTYTGTVTAVGDFPSQSDGWNGIGNPNASYYPFTVFVDETADLQAGAYASIQYSTAGTEHGIYLENPFIRSEQGKYYVYLRGNDGQLEKREVTVGKSLWGNYKEILSGLTEEDLIAFPYGKNLKEGAQTVESDLSVLYEY